MRFPSFSNCLIAGCLLLSATCFSQPTLYSSIYAKQTLNTERVKRREGLYKYTILPLLNQSPDSTNEFSFQTALWNISQYALKNDTTRRIVDTLINHYATLETGTRRSLLEVVYALYPTEYDKTLKQLWPNENDDRLLAITALYLKRASQLNEKEARKKLQQNKSHYDSSAILQQVISSFSPTANASQPANLTTFFQHQTALGCKVIYSLQRPDRNYPGLAIIQNADGSLVKDTLTGKLKTFVQLARSAADLPYFITNGSTPQGAYRIMGTGISQNSAIGPTPNIQLRLPFELYGDTFFIHAAQPILNDSTFLEEYKKLFPIDWQTAAMQESFVAGKCGRGAIIAHGTTLDPWWYQQQSYYPCTPTLGCLCAKETWNPYTGRLQQSDQLDMVNAFVSTPSTDGYLFVINLADKKSAVTPEEVTALVNAFKQ